jgi:GNAT superfamily N-acetyltransferase
MTEIRPAQPDDGQSMLAIGPEHLANPEHISEVVGAGSSLVAIEDGDVVGYAAIDSRNFFGRDFIDLLYVDLANRRRGIGRRLMQEAVRQSSTPRIFTSTNGSNEPMRSLLAANGWILSGVLDGLDEGDPEWVYFHDAVDVYGGEDQ